MAREEQIEQAWFCKTLLSSHCYDEKSFKEAAQWADKTMTEKACNWLEVQLDRFKLGDNKIKVDFVDKEKFIDLFKKAMEE